MEKRPKGGNNRAKLTDEQKESFCGILEEDCSPTIQRICDLFLRRHHIRIGRSTAARCFKLSLYIKNPPASSRKAQEGICHELSKNSSASTIFFSSTKAAFMYI
ncbi:hypothetical protein RF11_00481 [Thelohanellus kitauei]|uniref:Uncharacterized protein n=1 Tax=Thelohanellus kitauei TaxID=669202 RepID=A0A0C2INT3_THEKT|nr:hypothetical protein RF11_00481 [Thelohanellus kitauei]